MTQAGRAGAAPPAAMAGGAPSQTYSSAEAGLWCRRPPRAAPASTHAASVGTTKRWRRRVSRRLSSAPTPSPKKAAVSTKFE
jgi:hypothetical protein